MRVLFEKKINGKYQFVGYIEMSEFYNWQDMMEFVSDYIFKSFADSEEVRVEFVPL